MKKALFSFAAAAAAPLVMFGVASTPVAGQGGTGTIVGHVKYMGPTPVNPIIRMGADPRCNKLYVGKRPTAPTFVVGTDGAFANVLVNLDGSFPATPVPATPAVLGQKDCQYAPRVLGARIGQTLQVTNEDPTDHNVHSLSKAGNDFNRTQMINGKPFDFTLKAGERAAGEGVARSDGHADADGRRPSGEDDNGGFHVCTGTENRERSNPRPRRPDADGDSSDTLIL